MPGTTANFGWAKPISSDPIAQGADTIGLGLDGIDAQFFVPADKFTAAEPYASYPLGTTVMRVASAATAAAGGWPVTTAGGIVITTRVQGMGTQHYYPAVSSAYQVLFRWYGNSPGAWAPILGPGMPTAQATGVLSGATITPGTTTALAVTFPAGRFTTAPRVFTQIQSNNPAVWSPPVCNNITTTGMTINILSPSAATVTCHWEAIQGAA